MATTKRTHECKAPHCEGGVSFETFGECEVCEGTGAVAADSPHAGRALVKDDGIYDEDGLRIGTEAPASPPSAAAMARAAEVVAASVPSDGTVSAAARALAKRA